MTNSLNSSNNRLSKRNFIILSDQFSAFFLILQIEYYFCLEQHLTSVTLQSDWISTKGIYKYRIFRDTL